MVVVHQSLPTNPASTIRATRSSSGRTTSIFIVVAFLSFQLGSWHGQYNVVRRGLPQTTVKTLTNHGVVSPSDRDMGAPLSTLEAALWTLQYAFPIDQESHTSTIRPPNVKADKRDAVLSNYPAVPCRHNATGRLIMGQDVRVIDEPNSYRMRNPKFVCGIEMLGMTGRRPCVVYSFGSWDEISFEVGLHIVAPHCEVHVFDPDKIPNRETQERYNFTAHRYPVVPRPNSVRGKTVREIMTALSHNHIDLFKIDIEGIELEILPNVQDDDLFKVIDQIQIEFHSVQGMRKGMDLLTQGGNDFAMVYARREDRCETCTEVALERQSTQSLDN